MSPLVSVIIPTKNRRVFLGGAIQSAIVQSHQNLEIIVSDNWSHDGTDELVANFLDKRLKFVRPSHPLSMTDNWNHALSYATGKYFLLLSDDDELAPDGIADLVGALNPQANEAYGNHLVVIGKVGVIGVAGELQGFTKVGNLREPAAQTVISFFRGWRSNYPCGNLLHTETARSFGGYNGLRYGVGADGALWMQLAFECGTVAHTERVVASYRSHILNTTSATTIDDWVRSSISLNRLVEVWYKDKLFTKCMFQSAGRTHAARLVCGLALIRSTNMLRPFKALGVAVLPHKKHLLNIEGLYYLSRAIVRLLCTVIVSPFR